MMFKPEDTDLQKFKKFFDEMGVGYCSFERTDMDKAKRYGSGGLALTGSTFVCFNDSDHFIGIENGEGHILKLPKSNPRKG